MAFIVDLNDTPKHCEMFRRDVPLTDANIDPGSSWTPMMHETAGAPLVSFVGIARNEEDVIGACLESLLRAAEGLPSWECIFVDSASEDRTVEVAMSYPISVIQLRNETHLTAGAGRHVGTLHASGEYVMFMDGDCELQTGFVERALEAFESDDSLGTVVGTRGTVYNRDSGKSAAVSGESVNWDKERDCEIASTGGIAMIRKSCLDLVGGFNPFMRSNEERELCLRVRSAGYRIRCIPVPMMIHCGYPWQSGEFSLRELRRRFSCGLMEGPGQLLRLAFETRTISKQHFEIGVSRALAFVGVCAVGFIAVIASIVTQTPLWGATWVTGCLVAYCAFAVKSRGLARPSYYTVGWALGALAIIIGFVRGYRMPTGLTPSYKILKNTAPTVRGVSPRGGVEPTSLCERTKSQYRTRQG